MEFDRPSDYRIEKTRRLSERMPVFERATWKREGWHDWRTGLLVNVSDSGLSFLTDPEKVPPVGRQITLRVGTRLWHRPAKVVRVDHLSGTLDLVAAEFSPPTA